MPPSAKTIRVAPIAAADANRIVRRYHYSGTVVPNSVLHFGVFLDGQCLGAMSFGPPLDKRKLIGLVRDTGWNDFLELNRMAFSDLLPRNSESRALSVAFRMIRAAYPHVRWIVSFSDATKSGDGTIYRAAGFVLTQINRNKNTFVTPGGEVVSRVTLSKGGHILGAAAGSSSAASAARALGAVKVPGFQLRYLYFLDPSARERLTCPVLPFSEIAKRGATMYRGVAGAGSIGGDAIPDQGKEGGSNPTPALLKVTPKRRTTAVPKKKPAKKPAKKKAAKKAQRPKK